MSDDHVLSVSDLAVRFPGPGGDFYQLLEHLSFSVAPGRCVGIVGESGSGKSMACLGLMGLVPRPGSATGQVLLDGLDVFAMSKEELRQTRGSKMAMVAQDPSAALNPLLTVEGHIGDVLRAHKFGSGEAIRARILAVLDDVGFPDAARRMKSYPFQLSGGLRQRVAIAMALACRPSVIIADEPTTNLDVSIQDQVLELFRERMRRDRFGMVFVSHDLGVISRVADTVLVMYGGQVVERGPTAAILGSPGHPYTRGLLAAAPTMNMDRAHRLVPIPGMLLRRPGAIPPCSFAPRCPTSQTAQCQPAAPDWHPMDPGGAHTIHCHIPEEAGA